VGACRTGAGAAEVAGALVVWAEDGACDDSDVACVAAAVVAGAALDFVVEVLLVLLVVLAVVVLPGSAWA
jgi:hypothetical protein